MQGSEAKARWGVGGQLSVSGARRKVAENYKRAGTVSLQP